MKTSEIQKLYSRYILPTYAQLPVCLVKGKGSRVWDLENREYLDFFPGWAVSGIGHCHPAVVQAIKNQARKILHISNNFYNVKQAQLAKKISEKAFPGKTFFCNSGAEAVEAAIKFTRLYGRKDQRSEIITFKKSFHGRTFAAMSATGQGRIHEPFEPGVAKFHHAEFNDLNSVKSFVNSRTVGIMIEPVQGEGGIRIPDESFMKGLRKICDDDGLLFIVDEIQTGMGKTGKMFAYEHFNIKPDLMTLAKSLGGGLAIGALLVGDHVKGDFFTPGTHGSTFGGNPVAAAAACAVFKAIEKEGLLQKTVVLGDMLRQGLQDLKEEFSEIVDVRSLGLMQALELSVPAAPYAERALEKGLLINATQNHVIRMIPAMTISKKELKKGLQILKSVFQSLKKG